MKADFLFTMKIKLEDLYDKVLFQIQYVDSNDSWTVPVLLTKERADKFLSDLSISKIKIHTPHGILELELC